MAEHLQVASQEHTTPSPEDIERREDFLKRYREARSATIASKFHENWRLGREKEKDGSYKPRPKTTKDEAWVAAHGTDQVDIANTDFFDLPQDWQQENAEAARVVYDLVDNHRTRPSVIDVYKDPAPSGNVVHDQWLNRNQWAAGGELDKPFSELPSDEQAKDIEQVEIGRQEFGYGQRRAA